MSTALPQESAEARELSLVGKVELRIALADTDTKLSSVLQTYLAPLLLKLASEHLKVRNKVISICQHINTRIKPHTVRLPVSVLLKQYKEQSSPLIRHFDLIYVQQGIVRLPPAERTDLLPVLITGIAADYESSATNAAILFHIIVRLLHSFPLPSRGSKEDTELRTRLAINDRDGDFLSFWFGKLLLLASPRPSGTSADVQLIGPGLSHEQFNFLTLGGKSEVFDSNTESSLDLTQSRLVVIKFVASGAFVDRERFKPGLFASADTTSEISEVGADILKRTATATSLDDPQLIQSLFDLYLGNQAPPVGVSLRIKILSQLAKSPTSTIFTSEIIRVVESGVIYDERPVSAATAPVSGRQGSKLRSAIFNYINFAARHGATQDLQVIAPALIVKLRSFINRQGWPVIDKDQSLTSEDRALRANAYELVGVLARAGPRELILEPGLDLLSWLFRSLAEEGSEGNIALSIEEALSSILHVFTSRLEPDIEESLRQLLLHQLNLASNTKSDPLSTEISTAPTHKTRRSTRFVAVRFANRCLAYGDVVARWIDIVAASDGAAGAQELLEEGRKGLDPYWYRMLNPPLLANPANQQQTDRYAFPRFTKLLEYVLLRPTNHSAQSAGEELSLERIQSFRRTNSTTFCNAIGYCHNVLMCEILRGSGVTLDIDIDWERKLEVAVTSSEQARTAIRDYLKARVTDVHSADALALNSLISAEFEGLAGNKGDFIYKSGQRFMQLCSLSPVELVAEVAPRFRALEPLITSNNHEVRLIAAQAFGVLASHSILPVDVVQSSAEPLLTIAASWKEAVGADLNRVHGAVVSLAHFLAYRGRVGELKNVSTKLIHLTLELLQTTTDTLLEEASIRAVDQLCTFLVLTPEYFSPDVIITTLARKAQSGKESAILALGHLAMIFDESSPHLARITEEICRLHELRQAELQFAVGEALSCVGSGWQSKALAATLDIAGPCPEGPRRTEQLLVVVDRTLETSKSTKPSLKKASAIWLLCLLQFCGHLRGMQQRLPSCQVAFKRCLSDRDELVQETASRGFGLIYEKASPELKSDLIHDIVGTFSSNRAQVSASVADDTQLFQPETLSTGDGSISTYKDVMSLASEVGNPSLVYRFMALARSDAIWTSRAAFGRFGVNAIFSDPGVDRYLNEHPKLYAKLYRYRFDPISSVQTAMKNIWEAVVKDPTAIIEKYFEFILEDLLADASILGNEWRTRQASCHAIADIIQIKPLDRWQKYLREILTKGFRVLDDIKDSVRRAGTGLAKVVTGILIRNLDSSASNANTMLVDVLPFLLSTSGLESSAQETRAFSLSALLDIVKKSNRKVIQPFIPQLVERLLALLSTMEPEVLNYLSLSASRHNLKGEQVDSVRLSSVRSSPLMEAIERCLDMLDEESVNELGERLGNALRAAIGLPSKLGCARVCMLLITRHMFLIKPHADKFLQLLLKYVVDRNDTVSSSYATAIGYIARGASDKENLGVVDWCRKIYFTSDENRHRLITGQVMEALSTYSTDRCSALGERLFPFVFLAKHDGDPNIKEVFGNVWNQLASGPRAVVLYLSEIVILAMQNLASPQWNIKRSAARSIATAIVSVAAVSGEISRAHAEIIWPALDMAIAGKTWDGKEVVLSSFVIFVEKGSSLWKEDARVGDKIMDVIIREGRRHNDEYRPHALRSIAAIALVRTDVDMSLTVSDIVAAIIEKLKTSEEDRRGSQEQSKILNDTIAAAVDALFASVNVRVASEITDFTERIVAFVDLAVAANSVPSREVNLATCRASQKLFKRLKNEAGTALQSVVDVETFGDKFLDLLIFGPIRVKEAPEALRIQWTEALVALLRLLVSASAAEELPSVAKLRSELSQIRANEKSTAVREVLEFAASSTDKDRA